MFIVSFHGLLYKAISCICSCRCQPKHVVVSSYKQVESVCEIRRRDGYRSYLLLDIVMQLIPTYSTYSKERNVPCLIDERFNGRLSIDCGIIIPFTRFLLTGGGTIRRLSCVDILQFLFFDAWGLVFLAFLLQG